MVSRLLDLLLPPRCGGCGGLGSWLCAECRCRVVRPPDPRCRRCGAELEFSGASCPCRRRLRGLARVRSAALYEGPVERAIHRFKYEGCRPLARPLAAILAEEWAGEETAVSAVLAVPLHPARQRQRGFNQSTLLVRELRRRLELAELPGQLERVRDTPAQVGLDRHHRRANLEGAFRWRGGRLEGIGVLLVDDVTTTGATLAACAEPLRAAGAGAVIGLTIARVRL